jgi:aminopeptidase N
MRYNFNSIYRNSSRATPLNDAYIEAMRSVLRHPTLDAAFKELVLTLPSETYIAEQLDVVDPQRIHAVREAMREQLAQALAPDWQWAFDAHRQNGGYRPDSVSSGRRHWRAWHWAICASLRAVRVTRSGLARPCSASRTQTT